MIKRLYVHNFRCLENFELLLAEKPSLLLIGENGAGKSTVSYALEIFQAIARGTNRISQIVKPSDLTRGRSDVPMRFVIEAEVNKATFEYSLALELPDGFRELRILEEKLSVDGQTVFSREKSQVTIAKTGKGGEAAFSVDWHLAALPIIQEKDSHDPLHIFKTWLARMLLVAPTPSLISGESDAETLSPQRTVNDLGNWFSGLLADYPAAYSTIDQCLKQVMPDFAEVINEKTGTDSRSIKMQFENGDATLNLPFRDLSDGEKCFFIWAVVSAANKAYGPLFCFWDEPDNYLSPDEVGSLVMDLRRKFQKGGQFIMTSHNGEAMRQFTDDDTFLLYRRSHFEPTLIRPVSELNIAGDIGEAVARGDLQIK